MNRSSPSWNRRRVTIGRAPHHNRGSPLKYVLLLVTLFLTLLFYYNLQIARHVLSDGRNQVENGKVMENSTLDEVHSKNEEPPITREDVEQVENSNEEVHEIVEKKDDNTRHVVFIMIGAVRAIEKTAFVTLQNLVAPLCSPTNCTSHLVMHLSYADNRPDENKHDPMGISISLEETSIQRIQSFIHDAFCSPTEGIDKESSSSRFKFQYCHEVSPAYDIGSSEEQTAMDTFESECCSNDPVLRNRLRSLRYGDPRRFSMWFARYHAWQFVETTLLSSTSHWGINSDNVQFMFVRPDLLWYLPFAPWEYLQYNTLSNRDIWIHDSYFANVPDTWAFLPNIDVAKGYFSLLTILEEGVGCLGGPDFEKSLVEERLTKMGILDPSKTAEAKIVLKWCTNDDPSWSEEILLAKLRRLNIHHRFIPAGVSLLRKEWLDCQPIHPYFKLDGDENHVPSFVPVLKCIMTAKHFFHEQGETLLEQIHGIEIFRIRATWNDTVCLTQLDDRGSLGIQPCKEHPIPQTQLFASSAHVQGLFSLWDRDVFLDVSNFTQLLEPWTSWKKDVLHPFDQVKSLELRRAGNELVLT